MTEAIRQVDAAFPEADRIWADVDHLDKVQSTFEGTLLNPIRIKAANDDLLLLDKGDASVLRYSPSGTLLSRIGGRVGEGPGELQFLQDTDAGSADVVVLDSRTRLIHRFSMAGTFLNRFDSGVLGLRIVDFDSAVVILDVSRPQPLIVLDTLGTVTRRFGSEISNKNRDPILSDGEIVRAGDGVVYLSRYYNSGLWIRLDDRVDSLRLKSGVDENELPRAPDYLRSGEWQSSESILMDAAVDSLILYCHVRLMGPSLRASVIDTYDLSTLEYVQSVLLDEPVRSATVLGNRIYAIQDTTVVSYEYAQ